MQLTLFELLFYINDHKKIIFNHAQYPAAFKFEGGDEDA